MQSISKANFKILLDDLYDIFNPDYKVYTEGLSEKYLSNPLDAVDMILFKYNNKNQSFYDPLMNDLEYKMNMVSQYAKSNRTLLNISVEKRKNEIKAQQDKKNQEEKEQERKDFEKIIDEKSEGIKKEATSELEKIKKEANSILDEVKGILESIKQSKKDASKDSGVQHEIKINTKIDGLILPNAKKIAGLGIGARVIAKTEEGRPVGLKVVDIIYDDVSHPENLTIITVILDKN